MTKKQQPNPLTYPTSSLPFSREVFASPPSEYRGAPFWGWVTKQDLKKTVEQVDMFKEMGMGGFHMHTRVGLDIPYMGDDFMAIVRACVERAKKTGLLAYLYDEDRWPSGFAGGKVLEGHPELKGLHLLWTPWQYGEEIGYTKPTFPIANAAPVRSELGTLLSAYAIKLDVEGKLVSSRRIGEDDKPDAGEAKWYAYAEPLPDSGFFGDQTYPDLLSADMTKRFIELTHEVYKENVGEDFGGAVPSMFTDEPQYSPIQTLNAATGHQDVFLPWTRGIDKSFASANPDLGALADLVPSIIYDRADGSRLARYRFIDHVGRLFADNYIGELARWCSINNLFCTGHMNGEARLATQAAQTGDIMRCYADMDVPGIDMLCDSSEYNTAKQAASVARQFGRRGVMSELYGVTGWRWTFEGHKGQGDWQAALGVTLRVPHLFWSTMAGEAKRDYPACIGYQSPWWREYAHVEDHFARVNSILTRGKPVTRVAVIHPIESYWLCFGPKDANFEELEYRDKAFADLTEWLLLSHLDFDFISESLFPRLTNLDDIVSDTLPVGECAYEAVIVPNLHTIRRSTLERLQRFAENGGEVIWAGTTPTLVDASDADADVKLPGKTIPWSKAQILAALQPRRDIDMTVSETTLYRNKGYRADSLVYQLREEDGQRWLFMCNTDRKEACPVDITLPGEWAVEVLDTLSGTNWDLAVETGAGSSRFQYYFDGCESTVFRLHRSDPRTTLGSQVILRKEFRQDRDVVLQSTTLSELNALLLDYAEYQWNDEAWAPAEEVLRIDQLMRERLGFFKKGAKFRQPYTIPPEGRAGAGTLRLKFSFTSEIDTPAKLAIEAPASVRITLDGEHVPSFSDGWYVDRDIHTIPLPALTTGSHTLELEYAYGPLTNLERVYVLGDFGVDVRGRTARIVPARALEWGDITRQGLPFYTGNVTYHCTFMSDGSTPRAIKVAHYAGPVVAIAVDGERPAGGLLIHEPRTCALGVLPAGEHRVDVTVYGDRHNAFGQIHLVPGKTNWLGADSWRSDFDWWSEEYVLEPIGVLNAPRVCVPGLEVPKQTRRGLAPH